MTDPNLMKELCVYQNEEQQCHLPKHILETPSITPKDPTLQCPLQAQPGCFYHTSHTPTPKSRERTLLKYITITTIVIAAITLAAAIAYVLTTPPTAVEASEQHIEDHYDAIAEQVVGFVFPNSSLKAEILAEIAESTAEAIFPYSCDQAGLCNISISILNVLPLPIHLKAPFQVNLEPDTGPFGQSGYQATDAQFLKDDLTINSLPPGSFDALKEKADDFIDDSQDLIDEAEQILDKMPRR